MPLLTSPKKALPDVLSHDPLAIAKEPIEMVKTYDKDILTTPVDLRWKPENALLVHVEGASWVVDYFSQYIVRDSDVAGLQRSATGVYQQYTLIASLDLKVTTPLSVAQDDETKSMSAEGSAVIYPFLIPNEGDMFIAELEPGKLALFRITATTRKSLFNQACYEISYGLDTTDVSKIENLRSKVVRNYYYHKDYFTFGQNPLLLKSEALAIIELSKLYKKILHYYVTRFLSVEYRTFIIPNQDFVIHDPWLTEFFTSVFTSTDHPLISRVVRLNTQSDTYMTSDSFWHAILNRDVFHMNTCFRKFTIVSRNQFDHIPWLAGYRYSGIGHLIYPTDALSNVDNTMTDRRKIGDDTPMLGSWNREQEPLWEEEFAITYSTNDDGEIINTDEGLDPAPPTNPYDWDERTKSDRYATVLHRNLRDPKLLYKSTIPSVSLKKWYVFGENFYKREAGMTAFEQMVWAYLDGQAIDPVQLGDIAKLYHAWGAVEQFYYLPILLSLMKSNRYGG